MKARTFAILSLFVGPHIVVRTVARDYAICGPRVVRQITWISDETLGHDGKPHWTYQATINNVANNKIPDFFLCLLKNNGYPLPAAQRISTGLDCDHPGLATVRNP